MGLVIAGPAAFAVLGTLPEGQSSGVVIVRSPQGKLGTNKDADMSPFEAARRLLSGETSQMSLMNRTELVFQDMDLVPLLIQVRPATRPLLGWKRQPTHSLSPFLRLACLFSRSCRRFCARCGWSCSLLLHLQTGQL